MISHFGQIRLYKVICKLVKFYQNLTAYTKSIKHVISTNSIESCCRKCASYVPLSMCLVVSRHLKTSHHCQSVSHEIFIAVKVIDLSRQRTCSSFSRFFLEIRIRDHRLLLLLRVLYLLPVYSNRLAVYRIDLPLVVSL